MIWIEGNSIPTSEPDGTVTWHGVIMDVTERKKIQDKINEQAAQLRTLSDNLPGVMIYQMAGSSYKDRRFTYVSNEVTRLTGQSAEEVMADPSLLYNGILPEDLPWFHWQKKDPLNSGRYLIGEDPFPDSHRGNQVAEYYFHAAFNRTGQFCMGWFSCGHNRKKTSRICHPGRRGRDSCFGGETAFDGILFYDNNGKILECNNSGAITMGYSREEMLEMNLSDLFLPRMTSNCVH